MSAFDTSRPSRTVPLTKTDLVTRGTTPAGELTVSQMAIRTRETKTNPRSGSAGANARHVTWRTERCGASTARTDPMMGVVKMGAYHGDSVVFPSLDTRLATQ